MGWLDAVVSFAPDSEVIYECRRCGTPTEAATDVCPACGSANIATYEF